MFVDIEVDEDVKEIKQKVNETVKETIVKESEVIKTKI